jgi:NADPH2:quinone reductase
VVVAVGAGVDPALVGTRVVAAAGGARKLDLCSSLGAELTADYTEPGWADRVRADAGGVDVAFDGVGGEIGRAAFELLRPGGRLLVYGLAGGSFTAVSDEEAAVRGVSVIRGAPLTPAQMVELIRAALAETAAGRLHPVIGQTFALEDAAAAHAAIEARATVGKTLLRVSKSAGEL